MLHTTKISLLKKLLTMTESCDYIKCTARKQLKPSNSISLKIYQVKYLQYKNNIFCKQQNYFWSFICRINPKHWNETSNGDHGEGRYAYGYLLSDETLVSDTNSEDKRYVDGFTILLCNCISLLLSYVFRLILF